MKIQTVRSRENRRAFDSPRFFPAVLLRNGGRRILAALISVAFTAGLFYALMLMNAGGLPVEPPPSHREVQVVLMEKRKPRPPRPAPRKQATHKPRKRELPAAAKKRITARKAGKPPSPGRQPPRRMDLPDLLGNVNLDPRVGLEGGPEIPMPGGAGGGPPEEPEELEEEEFKEGVVDIPPRVARKRAPSYPRTARREEIEGHVVAEFLVDREGRVRDVRIVKSVPRGVFDEAVLSALRAYRFHPARHGGKPVNCLCRKTFRFVLWN